MTTVPGLQRDTVALTDLLHLVKASGGDPRDRAQLVSELRGLILPPVKDRDVADPSTLTPTEGDTYIVAASGVGDWAGQDGNIAVYVNETIDGTIVAWRFIPAAENMLVYVVDEDLFYTYASGNWAVALTAPTGTLALSTFRQGTLSAGETLLLWVSDRSFDLPAGLTGSQGRAEVAPASDALTLDIQKNGSAVGSVSFAVGSRTPTFSMASKTSFAAGDRVKIVEASATLDTTVAGVAVTLTGTKT